MGRLLNGVNAMSILRKLCQTLPDETLETIADHVLVVADEIKVIRSDSYYGTTGAIQDHSVAEAS